MNSDDTKQNVDLKNNNKDSTIKFNVKLKKIKLAKSLALTKSRKKKVATNANELESNVDDRIRSVALSKFIFRKASRLKKLGKIKSEINSVIIDLTTSEDNILTRSQTALQGFGLDKKFIGLSVDDILQKINPAYNKNDEPSDEPSDENLPDNQTSPNKENSQVDFFIPDDENNSLNKPNETSKTSKTSKTNESIETVDTDDNNLVTVVEQIKKIEEEVRQIKDVQQIKDVKYVKDVKQVQQTSNVGNVGNDQQIKLVKPDTKQSNADDSNSSKKENSPASLDVRVNKNVDTKEDVEQNNDKIYEYLVQKGELGIADYILDLMTTPEPKEKNLSEIKANTVEIKHLSVINSDIRKSLQELEENVVDEQDTSISIPQKLEAESQKDTTVGVEKEGTGFLESILEMLFGKNILKLLMSSGSVLGFATSILGTGWSFISGKVSTLFGTMIKKSLKPFKLILDGFKLVMEKIKSAISKIPGIKKLLPDFKSTKGIKDKKETKKLSKATKSAKESKLSIEKDTDKKTKKASKYSKKLSSSKIKGFKKPTGLLKKLTKFTKVIPFIGTAITAGTAIYSAQDGYRNAGEILGKENTNLTTTDKLAAAAGSLINDVSFGLMSTKQSAEKILKATEPKDELIQKYENKGLIDCDVIGNSEVLDWNAMNTIPAKDLKEIIDYDDWSKEDEEKLTQIYNKKTKVKNESKSDAASSKQTKINDLETGIVALKSEKLKAEETNDTAKEDSVAKSIKTLEKRILALSKATRGEKTTKEYIDKTTQMQKVENTSRTLVETTKNTYTNKTPTKQANTSGMSSINNISTPAKNYKPHELFEK